MAAWKRLCRQPMGKKPKPSDERGRALFPVSVPNRALGAATALEVQALKADLEQARHELFGTSCELVSTKAIFEKARRHLIQLQTNVTLLRDERHELANRAMEADAYKRKYEQVTIERDFLRRELAAAQAKIKWQA